MRYPTMAARAVLCVDAGYDLEYVRCMGFAQHNFLVDEIYCGKSFVRVVDLMFLLLPLNLGISDLDGMVEFCYKDSGNL